MIRLAALLILLASAVQAFDLPALYRVSGVDAGDVLNIRSAPRADADIIGALAATSDGIEVTRLSADGSWAGINTEERSGWVALRFLERTSDPDSPPAAECLGTEPFWSLSIAEQITLDQPGGVPFSFRVTHRLRSTNRTDRSALAASGPFGSMTATIAAQSCSDGMSDRHYGLSLDAVLDWQTGQPTMISGCCSLRN